MNTTPTVKLDLDAWELEKLREVHLEEKDYAVRQEDFIDAEYHKNKLAGIETAQAKLRADGKGKNANR